MISKITDKFQTTIPKSIREKLKLFKHDAIEWEIEDNKAVVFKKKKPFLQYQGIIKTGKGDIEKDIQKAKQLTAKKMQ